MAQKNETNVKFEEKLTGDSWIVDNNDGSVEGDGISTGSSSISKNSNSLSDSIMEGVSDDSVA